MTKADEKVISNREVKDSVFTTYFREPENASQLYAALGEEEVSPEDITYVTREGVLFIARKNLLNRSRQAILDLLEDLGEIPQNLQSRILAESFAAFSRKDELNEELIRDRLDDWIRLFRVESMEELIMVQSLNPGVMEADRR